MEINEWDVSAIGNGFTPPDGAPTNTVKLGQVDNIIRELMAVLARWNHDVETSVLSTGSVNAYSVELARDIASLYDGFTFMWKTHTNNTGATTLSVNGFSAKPVVDRNGRVLSSGTLVGQPVLTLYSASLDSYIVNVSIEAHPPIGSKLLFPQASTPAGWSLNTTVNDAMIMVSSSSGGVEGGSWTISGLSVLGHTLTINEIPPHHHGGAPGQAAGAGGGSAYYNRNGVTEDTGGGDAHSHGLSADGNWRPKYLTVIKCTRAS